VVAELRDVRAFLGGQLPFTVLPDAALEALSRRVLVRYLRRGSEFPPADADSGCFYVLRKGAVELRDRDGALLDRLAEGESFDATALGASPDQMVEGVTVEDTLVYVLAGTVLAELRKTYAAFDAVFEDSLGARLRRVRETAHGSQAGGNLLRLRVADLVTRSPVTAPPDLPLREAARLMTRERVSSLLVVADGSLRGIVTDRDLRSRCVAAGLDGTVPLHRVMSVDPHTIARDASAFEALMTMSRMRIHHLPVADEEGVHGLISTHDLLRAQATNPLYLADRVGRCATIACLQEALAETRELHVQLVAANATARQLGQAVTSVCDATTRHLIELEIARIGEPPVPFAWVATGSQGRGELTLRSDQDNAMLLDDSFVAERHGDYFAMLARAVNEGLHECGYVHCPGEVMASNPQWRRPVQSWRANFLDWIERTDHKTVTLAANFFDMRTVWGDEPLRARLMAEILPRCVGQKVFQAYLAGHALGNQPPLGFFRNFVLVRSGAHEGTLDIKRHGLLPIVDLARVYALSCGLEAVGTLQRLQGSVERGSLTAEGSESLQAAFEFIWTIRARHQAAQLRSNEPVDNFVAPDALTETERRHLKDAFAAIATMQNALRAAHGDRLPL